MIQRYRISTGENFGRVASFFYCYPEAMDALRAEIPERATGFEFETLTVGDLLELLSGQFPRTIKNDIEAMTVEAATQKINAVMDGLDLFIRALQATTPPEDIEAAARRRGTIAATIEEAILWTVRDTFALHGFEDAAKLSIYEYLAARKKIYNETIIDYNSNIMRGNIRRM